MLGAILIIQSYGRTLYAVVQAVPALGHHVHSWTEAEL